MDFLIILALKYALFTASLFLIGVLMQCFFNEEKEHYEKV